MKEIWASISGGKDSTRMFKFYMDNIDTFYPILIKGFFCALIRKLEFPDVVEHIYNMKKIAESKGVPFVIYENRNPIEPFMAEVITDKRSPHYGKVRGFPLLLSPCWISRDWKKKLIDRFEKQRKVISETDTISALGFAIDEKSKVRKNKIKKYLEGALKEDVRYPLVDLRKTEEDCRSEIVKAGLFCNSHIKYNRTGCWCCQKSPREARLMAIAECPERLQDIRDWCRLSQREIFVDLTLKEIEEYYLNENGHLPKYIPTVYEWRIE